MIQYLDTATLFLFGESIGSLSAATPAHAQGFLEAFAAGFSGSGMRIALGPFKILLSKSKWLEACETTHRFADFYADKALQHRQDFLAGENKAVEGGCIQPQILLYNMAEQTGDRNDLRNQILQAMMAAQETTANLLSNVFFLLARNPNVMQRLRTEALSVGSSELNLDQLAKMKYLRNVLNEGTTF